MVLLVGSMEGGPYEYLVFVEAAWLMGFWSRDGFSNWMIAFRNHCRNDWNFFCLMHLSRTRVCTVIYFPDRLWLVWSLFWGVICIFFLLIWVSGIPCLHVVYPGWNPFVRHLVSFHLAIQTNKKFKKKPQFCCLYISVNFRREVKNTFTYSKPRDVVILSG